MTLRTQPAPLYAAALGIFALAAIVPVAYMLVSFAIGCATDPSAAAGVIVDCRQLVLLARSMNIALSATLIALVIGTPVAFILAAGDLPRPKLFYFLMLVPLFIPPYITAGAWIHLLAPAGFVNKVILNVFGAGRRLTVFSNAGCAWCLGISFFPVVAVILAAGLSSLDRNLQDITRLSTNRWGTLRYSTLPQILPHLAASICLVMIFILGRYGVPSLLGISTYPVEIFAQFSAFYDDNAAVAGALPLMCVVVVLILLQHRIMSNRSYVALTPSSETTTPIRLGRLRICAVGFLILLSLLTTIAPFASVLACTNGLGEIYSTLYQYRAAIITTSALALAAAITSTAIAMPIGRYLAGRKGLPASLIDGLSWLPIAVPGTILALGLLKLSGTASALRNADSVGFLLFWAYVGMFSAFAIRIFQAAYKHADPHVAEAAALDCKNPFQHLWQIDVPIHARSIASSMIVVFVLAVGELNATVLLIPPGRTTLAVTIDNLLHYGANAKASALCLAEAVLVITAAGALCVLHNSRKGTR